MGMWFSDWIMEGPLAWEIGTRRGEGISNFLVHQLFWMEKKSHLELNEVLHFFRNETLHLSGQGVFFFQNKENRRWFWNQMFFFCTLMLKRDLTLLRMTEGLWMCHCPLKIQTEKGSSGPRSPSVYFDFSYCMGDQRMGTSNHFCAEPISLHATYKDCLLKIVAANLLNF